MTKKMIVIIDYGLGNLASVKNAISHLGYDCCVSSNSNDILNASHLILPGVGAFADGIEKLKKEHEFLESFKKKALVERVPVLGICLGMQLMCSKSYEFGETDGLGWFPFEVRPFPESTLRIPHMGWNNIRAVRKNDLFEIQIGEEADMYFVHNFYIDDKDKQYTVAVCDYGIEFTCMLQKENLYGAQFHPEKSQQYGLKILKNFCELN